MSPPYNHPSEVKSHPPPPPPSPLIHEYPQLHALADCLYVCDSLHHFLALYGYFGAVGRLTLHTLLSIVKDQSSKL